jgi:uncharacterized membrane protein
MRLTILALSAVAMAMTVTSPGVAAPAAQGQIFCDAEHRCIMASAQGYNDCLNLALSRGWNLSKTDYRGLNGFIYRCLSGRIPR